MLNVENVQRVARALSIPVTLFFEDTKKPVAVNDSIVISSTDEKTLLKHFKQIESNPDRLAVIQVARRLAVKGIT